MNSREALEKLINDIQEQGQVLTKKPNLIINFNVNISTFMDTIENAIKDLDRLEKLEEAHKNLWDIAYNKYYKVIKILKDYLGIELWKTSDGKYYLRDGYHDILLTQEEYDLLKEHLGNDEK